jgi:putative intracellular protease/amidase
MKILMILTSHSDLGETGKKTGFWLEEFTTPYYVFVDAQSSVTLASPEGGQPPLDPKSDQEDSQTDSTKRFKADTTAQHLLANTEKLSNIVPQMYDAVFYAGGHGPLWDLTNNAESIALIENMNAAAKPIGAVCHAPTVLLNVRNPDGTYIVDQRQVTGFSNSEEAAVELSEIVPFLLEDELQARGGIYSKQDDWTPYSISDGNLVTGQNPASSKKVSEAILSLLAAETAILAGEQP